ncbi:MAG: substrate-binding domain-containing protein [Candidatus Coproplasma sp.]
MKKLKSLILAIIMLVVSIASAIGFAACGGGVDIAFCMSQSNELNEAIEDALQEAFPGQKVRSENANSNSTTQTDQVNNFITMGVKMLVVSPVSLEALQAPLNEARAAGIKVVVSGATTQGVDCYDAVTVSDEFLLGSYIAMLGKLWAEDNMQGKTFDTVICYNNDFEDNINRSNGIRTITSEKLKNKSGQWIDADGNVVSSEAEAADNPAYCEMLTTGGNHVHEYAMTPNQTMSEYMPSIKAMYPNARLFLLYGSLAAPTMSNEIVANTTGANLDEYAIFGGGVSGTQEPACLLGSLASGVGKTFTQSGQTVTGIKSIFRGAVSFGGADAAKSVVDLCKRVYEGEAGVDYVKNNVEPLGVWYALNAQGDTPDTLACLPINVPMGTPVSAFDPIEALKNPEIEIKWQNV